MGPGVLPPELMLSPCTSVTLTQLAALLQSSSALTLHACLGEAVQQTLRGYQNMVPKGRGLGQCVHLKHCPLGMRRGIVLVLNWVSWLYYKETKENRTTAMHYHHRWAMVACYPVSGKRWLFSYHGMDTARAHSA